MRPERRFSTFLWKSVALFLGVIALASVSVALPDDKSSVPIKFEFSPHDAGVATEPREAFSVDRKVVARVVGEKFKPSVRLYDAASGDVAR